MFRMGGFVDRGGGGWGGDKMGGEGEGEGGGDATFDTCNHGTREKGYPFIWLGVSSNDHLNVDV